MISSLARKCVGIWTGLSDPKDKRRPAASSVWAVFSCSMPAGAMLPKKHLQEGYKGTPGPEHSAGRILQPAATAL